jgi:ribosome-binding ATPase YchF (GTP1/OBG family)
MANSMHFMLTHDKRGCTAPEAAAVIHSDFERGFIK